jgi:hypothetical protein
MQTIANMAARVENAPDDFGPRDESQQWAMVIAIVANMRVIIELLLGRPNPKGEWVHNDLDMAPEKFITSSSPPEIEAVDRLKAVLPRIDEDVAHLSWGRIMRLESWNWQETFLALVPVFADFALAVEQHGSHMSPYLKGAMERSIEVARRLDDRPDAGRKE